MRTSRVEATNDVYVSFVRTVKACYRSTSLMSLWLTRDLSIMPLASIEAEIAKVQRLLTAIAHSERTWRTTKRRYRDEQDQANVCRLP